MTGQTQVDIRMGALAPRIREQLDGLIADEGLIERLDRYELYITTLAVAGLLTVGEKNRARDRLMKMIKSALAKPV